MDEPDGSAGQYLVEWYGAALTRAPIVHTAAQLEVGAAEAREIGATVHLELTLAAPADEVLYSVFTADCAETVLLACRRAGYPPDRVTAGVSAHVNADP